MRPAGMPTSKAGTKAAGPGKGNGESAGLTTEAFKSMDARNMPSL
jgi:hypothetical protein